MAIKKMIQTIKTKVSDSNIFRTNRDKLMRIILEKITILDMLFYKSKSYEYRDKVRLALEKLENLLKIQGYVDQDLNDADYKSIKKFVNLTVNYFERVK